VCNTIKFEWFWSFVNKRCSKYDANMSQLSCQRCDDYSVTMCSADAKACYSTEQNNINYACPYAACREGILEFVLDQFTPLSYVIKED